MRVIFRMPLYAEGKCFRTSNADCFDGAIIGDAFNDDALALVEHTLTVQ